MKELYKIAVSNLKHKKYTVYVKGSNGKPKKIHFGDKNYGQYQDTTPLQAYKSKDHLDNVRRSLYLKRAKAIKKNGKESYKDINSANYYSVKYLWGG